jgi:hypothetical protein
VLTIFCYPNEVEFREELELITANKDHHMWFNPEDLDDCWTEALEAADMVYSYFVALDMNMNIVREYTRKD